MNVFRCICMYVQDIRIVYSGKTYISASNTCWTTMKSICSYGSVLYQMAQPPTIPSFPLFCPGGRARHPGVPHALPGRRLIIGLGAFLDFRLGSSRTTTETRSLLGMTFHWRAARSGHGLAMLSWGGSLVIGLVVFIDTQWTGPFVLIEFDWYFCLYVFPCFSYFFPYHQLSLKFSSRYQLMWFFSGGFQCQSDPGTCQRWWYSLFPV